MENMMNSDHKDNQNKNWQNNYDRIFNPCKCEKGGDCVGCGKKKKGK